MAANAGAAEVRPAGLLAGVFGTAVLSAFERLEWAALARTAVYAPAHVGRGLAARWFAGALSPARGMRFGHALRWVYGPSLGMLFTSVRGVLPRNPLAAGLCFGVGIFAFEVAVMPAVSATPPVRAWSSAERWLLVVHTAVFGVATAFAAEVVAAGTPRLGRHRRQGVTALRGYGRGAPPSRRARDGRTHARRFDPPD